MTHSFGCQQCWPESPEHAWEARGRLQHHAELVDESHFHVMVLRCDSCRQHYVSIFTETIDWADGEDPQHWIVLPITPEELGELERAQSVRESMLDALGPERRSLVRDYPKRAEPTTFWSAGVRVPMHD